MTRESAPRVAVVGGSLAGLRAAEGLRKGGFDDEIVIFDTEHHLPYNRPPLSKGTHQADELSASALALRRPRSIQDVTWRLGTAVVGSDLQDRMLTLSDGTTMSYDGLVCASGLDVRRLPGEGGHLRHVIRTIDDAQRLFPAMAEHGSLLVVGAGFLGCEVASVAADAGIAVTVVAPEAVPMERPLGRMVGEVFLDRHRAKGVNLRMGRSIRQVWEVDGLSVFTLDDGSELRAPVVLEAIGGIPSVGWLEGNGVDISNGILAEADLRVSGFDTVFACGDIARWPNARFGSDPGRVEHWTTSSESGRTAGMNLAAALRGDETVPFTPLPSFWSDQLGLRIQSFGSPGLSREDATVLEGSLDGEFVAGYHVDGRLVGVVLVGLANRMQYYRELVADELLATAAP